jgi:hypothetical protein
MPANTAPIFGLTPNVGHTTIPNANTNSDGTGNLTSSITIYKLFTAGGNGSWVNKARINVTATTSPTTSNATVIRLYYSTITSGATTSADTKLLAEVAVPAVSADHSTAPTNPIEVPLNFAIPTGSFIHVSSHSAPASAQQYEVVCFGSDF